MSGWLPFLRFSLQSKDETKDTDDEDDYNEAAYAVSVDYKDDREVDALTEVYKAMLTASPHSRGDENESERVADERAKMQKYRRKVDGNIKEWEASYTARLHRVARWLAAKQVNVRQQEESERVQNVANHHQNLVRSRLAESPPRTRPFKPS